MRTKEELAAELDLLLEESLASVHEREVSTFDKMALPFDGSFVLFGAGGLGQRTAAGLRRLGIEPLAFSDNNSAIWGEKIYGLAVVPPAEAVKTFGSRAAFIVSIWSDGIGHPLQEVAGQLNEYGAAKVISFASLYWKYPSTFLPYFSLDLPHKTIEQAAKIKTALSLWTDLYSRQEFLAQIQWRLHLDFSRLHQPVAGATYFPDGLYDPLNTEVFVDGGAFDGDTLRQFLRLTKGRFCAIFAFEPDAVNFSRLNKYVLSLDQQLKRRITLYPAAIGVKSGRVRFESSGTTQSAIKGEGNTDIDVVALDDVLVGEKTYVS